MTDLHIGDVVAADFNVYPAKMGTEVLRSYAFAHGNEFTVTEVIGESDTPALVRLFEFGTTTFFAERFKRIQSPRINITDNDLQELLDG